MSAIPTITLNNGVKIPQIGFGVFQIDDDATTAAVSEALAAGSRSRCGFRGERRREQRWREREQRREWWRRSLVPPGASTSRRSLTGPRQRTGFRSDPRCNPVPR